MERPCPVTSGDRHMTGTPHVCPSVCLSVTSLYSISLFLCAFSLSTIFSISLRLSLPPSLSVPLSLSHFSLALILPQICFLISYYCTLSSFPKLFSSIYLCFVFLGERTLATFTPLRLLLFSYIPFLDLSSLAICFSFWLSVNKNGSHSVISYLHMIIV